MSTQRCKNCPNVKKRDCSNSCVNHPDNKDYQVINMPKPFVFIEGKEKKVKEE